MKIPRGAPGRLPALPPKTKPSAVASRAPKSRPQAAKAPTPALREFFAITAPGLAPVCAQELRVLGFKPGVADDAGVTFRGGIADGARAAFHLRSASRVVMRLAEFEATSFAELEKRARKVGWNEVLAPGAPVRMRVTCKKSRLYHSDAVAQRVGDAIRLAVGAAATTAEGPEDADESDDQTTLIVVRFFRDQCTISADLSGALLHRRGYRLATAKAPIRETLAAALLLASGYDGSAPLLDPMCGSGTLPIEAAMIARRIAPGLQRAFAVERWPIHDAAAWREMRAAAAAAVLPHAPHVIAGSDRDAGAITASAANAKRAGVADDIVFSATPVSTMPVPAGRHGWIVVNPPYGVRVGERKPLRDLYAAFGRTMRTRAPGWTLAIVAAHPSLLAPLEVPLTAALSTSNGGIGVQFMTGTIPQGTE